MLTIHVQNAIPNITVFVTVAQIDGEEPKKIILLALRETSAPGTVLHADTIGPGKSCYVKFEDRGETVDLINHGGFIVRYTSVNDQEGIFSLEGLQQ